MRAQERLAKNYGSRGTVPQQGEFYMPDEIDHAQSN